MMLTTKNRLIVPIISLLTFGCVPNFAPLALAEDPDHAKHIEQNPDADHQVPQKTTDPLAPLQKALEKKSLKIKQTSKVASSTMSNDSMKPTEIAPAAPAGMGGGGMMDMMGMMSQMMGQMMPPMASPKMNPETSIPTSSELPGFPGASHIYHIGATGFFIDHADMIKLTPEQVMLLNKLKEKSLLANSTITRKIQQGEEDLWTLTAKDQPAIKNIETKILEISALKTEQRINFIRNVGEAARILTAEQRSILLGHTSKKSNPTSTM